MKPLHILLLAALSFSFTSTADPAPPVQVPIFAHPLPAMPPPGSGSGSGSVPLADILGTHRSLTSFSSFTRLHASTASLLADVATNTTVLAPLNSAVEALPRKPWEQARDYAAYGTQAYDGSGGEDRANQNLRLFVEGHLVARSPWPQGERAKTVGGREVWWEDRDGKRVVMPDEVEVDKVASQVSNGEVWILKGVLNYL
ncbi:FAS1 domain-containing protein [Tolypocladium paradoxum]|uniref:FAS1 domain-containing protein n=1 Tax=Tolypocladium paradoxum TaxID=94208 RepID=A0A2S4KZ70_9HYPO|nr:FAS1 domain-containing protein [Tolypocladium paradoxum]